MGYLKNVSRRGFVKGAGVVAAAATMAGLAGCSGGDSGSASGDSVKIEMVTDTGGVNDQSFNQLAWAGLQQLGEENGWEVGYLESTQEADYAPTLIVA